MLDCYFVGVCVGSTVDAQTQNLSIFNFVEDLAVPDAALGQPVALEVHAYFFVAPDGRSRSIEMRVVRVSEEGADDVGDPVRFDTLDKPRMRIRVGALRLPRAYGFYKLRVEWRIAGTDEWHVGTARWPLVLSPGVAPPEGAQELPSP